jgi:hypothetical protein
MNPTAERGATQIGLHSVRNILGEQPQVYLFDEHDQKFCEEFGLKLSGKIDRFGIDLSEIQTRVMEGILRGFSETAYRGNLKAKDKLQIAEEKYSGKLPMAYNYIQEIPRLKATQSQILDWAGINKNSIASWARALEALEDLGTKQYCFYYDRLILDEKGKPLRDINDRWKKEEVVAVDTLFTIKEVRDGDKGTIKYYEIIPSSIFLDQRESYFMLIPYNWREEVKALFGNRKSSSYTFRFLLFLRYQYEIKRRYDKTQKPHQIKWSYEEIAIAIKMPESIYKRKRKRALEILDDAYSVAKKLGYLIDFEKKDQIHTLTLNDSKYYNFNNKDLKEAMIAIGGACQNNNSISDYILNVFIENRTKLEGEKGGQLIKYSKKEVGLLKTLLEERAAEDIENVIRWSTQQKFWCSRLGTIEKLVKHFSAAWSEYSLFKQKDRGNRKDEHKKWAQEKLGPIDGVKFGQACVLLCNQYVEIGNGVHQPSCIEYEDKAFKEKVLCAMNRWRIPLS